MRSANKILGINISFMMSLAVMLLFAGLDAASATVMTVSGSTSTDIQNVVNKASRPSTPRYVVLFGMFAIRNRI
jgi:surface polysaccharide O-acyltransferase-like enzyme